jgi:hypothetical protein
MLKEHYSPGEVENIGFDGNACFALMKKKRQMLVGGKKWIQPVGTSLVNRGSSTFSTANGASGGGVANNQSNYDAFEVERAAHYRVARLDNQTLEASDTGKIDAFEPAIDEVNRCIKAEGNWANFRMYRGRGGWIGRMTNTAFNTTAITVDDPAALWAVSKNDVIRFSSTDGTSGALRAGSLTVASVVHPAPGGTGIINVTANIDPTITGPTTNDYIFLDGDFGAAPAGFSDYVPDTAAEAATTLFGFDRSVDNRLGGARVDGRSMSIHELITDMVSVHVSFSGEYASGRKTLFAHPFTLGNLSKQIDGKWIIMQAASYEGGKSASIGVRAFQVDMMGVQLNIIPDRMCPVKRTYLIDLEAWTLFHTATFPHFLLEKYGNGVLKPSETLDGWETRVGGYLNSCTKSPQSNVVGLVA